MTGLGLQDFGERAETFPPPYPDQVLDAAEQVIERETIELAS
jgi:hypothetical protein